MKIFVKSQPGSELFGSNLYPTVSLLSQAAVSQSSVSTGIQKVWAYWYFSPRLLWASSWVIFLPASLLMLPPIFWISFIILCRSAFLLKPLKTMMDS